MFDNLAKDLQTIIVAVKNPTVETISAALVAAGDVVKIGADVFATFFGKMQAGMSHAACLAECEAFVAECSGPGMKAVDAARIPWAAIFQLIQTLLGKVLPVVV